MGKYPTSPIHKWFSDWHIDKCKKSAYLTDIDRLWMEIRNGNIGEPVVIFDLKYLEEFEEQGKYTREIMADWFETRGIKFYTVLIDSEHLIFTRIRWKTKRKIKMTENQFIEWINSDFKIINGSELKFENETKLSFGEQLKLFSKE